MRLKAEESVTGKEAAGAESESRHSSRDGERLGVYICRLTH